MGTLYGWYNDDGDAGSADPLAPGEGLWIEAPDESFLIQSAGEVYTEAVPIQLQSGSTLCANPCPINTLTLNDAKISGYGDEYIGCEVVLTRLDPDGNVLDDIFWTWFDCENHPSLGTLYGWYNDDGDDGTTSPVALGEALWVEAPDESFYLTFPKTLIAQ